MNWINAKLLSGAVFGSVLLLAATPGQCADIAVEILDNRFVPEVVSADPGDTVIFTVVQGRHQLEADASTPISGLPSSALETGESLALTLTDPPGDYFFYSTAQENFRGALSIADASESYIIDNRISSGWFNPDAAGQGLLFEYVPSSNVVVAYWFTFDFSSGEQLWLIGTGQPENDQVTMEMVSAVGGVLNNSAPVSKPVWGELTVNFSDCDNATAWFDASQAQQSGQVNLDRLYLTSLCEQE
ncbi:MAG: hypothetical protein AB8B96_00260 [Lysobacterales bacterium]